MVYMVLKAQPQKLSTDLRFTKMFFPDEQQTISVFESVAEYIINNINRNTFKNNNVDPEEYDLYCLRARNGEIV